MEYILGTLFTRSIRTSKYWISDSPNEIKVIYAAINMTSDIMNELKTNIIFLAVDQAIYTKVLDAMFKQEEGLEIFKKIIPRMGAFILLFVC